MKQTDKITVDLADRSYDIVIGYDLYKNLKEHLPNDLIIKDQNIFIITDENVLNPHVSNYKDSIENLGAKQVFEFVLPPGEATKSFSNVEKICHWMLENSIKRDSIVFTIGGGVIGDLGAFTASIIMRGVRFVQVPTTLLSQVDSSVGGKTGINTHHGKNLIGTFYQPRAVLCDIATLETLNKREVLAGYAEVVKYGLINNEKFFSWLSNSGGKVCDKDVDSLIYAIKTSCQSKADIVAQDEMESGCRALLNLGHTFGHALESVCGYNGTLLHGEGVSIGMVIAFDVSEKMEFCPKGTTQKVIDHLKSIGLPTRIADITGLKDKPSAEYLYDLMRGDKKATAKAINFIMARDIGDAFITKDVHKDIILQSLENSM